MIGAFYNSGFDVSEWTHASKGLLIILYIGTIVLEYFFRQVRKYDNKSIIR